VHTIVFASNYESADTALFAITYREDATVLLSALIKVSCKHIRRIVNLLYVFCFMYTGALRRFEAALSVSGMGSRRIT
jgi:hypothetical protein